MSMYNLALNIRYTLREELFFGFAIEIFMYKRGISEQIEKDIGTEHLMLKVCRMRNEIES